MPMKRLTRPIHQDFLAGHPWPLIAWLRRGGNPDTEVHADGTTLLHEAVYRRQKAVVRELLRQGAAVNACDDNDQTALYCASGRSVSITELLLTHGADSNRMTLFRDVPLINAIGSRRPDIVAVLLAHGADVHQGNHVGRTALHIAASMGDGATCRLLLEAGADASRPDQFGLRAHDLADRSARAVLDAARLQDTLPPARAGTRKRNRL